MYNVKYKKCIDITKTIQLKELSYDDVVNMKKHCESTMVCTGCKYRNMCVKWTELEGTYTPSREPLEKLTRFYKVRRKDIKQHFELGNNYNYNSKVFKYYRHLIINYCNAKNVLMCEDWLHFDNFNKYYQEQLKGGKTKPRLKTNSDIINKETLVFN